MKSLNFKSVSLKNFKNLKDAKIDLRALNVLVGANNSGKSNFLSITTSLNRFFKGGSQGRSFFARELFGKGPNFEFVLEYEVTSGELHFDCKYHLTIAKGRYIEESGKFSRSSIKIIQEILEYKEVRARGPFRTFFKREGDALQFGQHIGTTLPKELEPKGDVSVVELIYSINSGLSENEKFIVDALISFCETKVFCPHKLNIDNEARVKKSLKALYEEGENSERYHKFVEFFKKALRLSSFDIQKISFGDENDPDDTAVYFCLITPEGSNRPVTFDSLSDGSKILFFLAFEVVFSSKNLIIIDEPEIGLHPMALNALFDFLREESASKKIILATHSSYLLNIVDPAIVVISEVSDDGRAVFTKVEDMPGLSTKLKSKYVNFGDLLAVGFRTKKIDLSLD